MKNLNRLQKLYSNQSIPLPMKTGMLSPELSPENKLNRMMMANSNNDIATSLNNIIKRKLPNSDLFNNQNNVFQNNILSNSAAAPQNLPMNSTDNWNEMNMPNQQQYQQNIQSLNSLVMNNSGSINGINEMNNLQNNILNNMNHTNNNIQMNNTAGNQYNAAASNYNNMQRLHNLQGINTNMNTNANNMNYVNSMISPELEYQNNVQQYQNYNFTPRQQQAFMNTNQHPQQQQQLYQRMNSANNANSQQQLPGDFFGQMLQQKQNVQPHGQSSIMNIPFQDPAIMAVRMGGNGQAASPYDTNTQMSPLEYLNSFNQNKK